MTNFFILSNLNITSELPGYIGLLSRELLPYVRSIVGVDISQRMVEEYNHRAANQGLSVDEMHAVRVDVLSLEENEVQNMKEKFDVIVVRRRIIGALIMNLSFHGSAPHRITILTILELQHKHCARSLDPEVLSSLSTF